MLRSGETRHRLITRKGSAVRATLCVSLGLLLASCATQVPSVVEDMPETPGSFAGLWHGMTFPIAWFFSLFADYGDIAVYAVPNNGGWYNFGYFIGVTALGGGTLKWLED
jgi:hypothetical protein